MDKKTIRVGNNFIKFVDKYGNILYRQKSFDFVYCEKVGMNIILDEVLQTGE